MNGFQELDRCVRWYVVRVVPYSEPIPDIFEPDDEDEGQWLLWNAMEDKAVRPLFKVFEDIKPWVLDQDQVEQYGEDIRDTLAESFLISAIHHPDSPFGIGARHKDTPASAEFSMFVLFHGQQYRRDGRGVLTEIPGVERVPGWPTREEYLDSEAFSFRLVQAEERERGARNNP